MVLICVPTSPRYGSILAAALSILEFVYLIFFFCTADFIEQKGFIALVVIFLILCIISAICLIVGVVRLNKLLITPFIVLMSLFIVSYAIVFIVMISGEHKDQTWIHFTLIAIHICYLIGPIALLNEIKRSEQFKTLNITVSPNPPPSYGYM